jgi:hypothetical protein
MASVPGFHEKRVEMAASFTRQVNEVARLICEELGLEPDELVKQADISGMWTPRDRLNVIMPDGVGSDFPVTCRRWELFRYQAALMLAGWRAVHKWTLSQPD